MNIDTFHLNEGHAGFLTLELMREQGYYDPDKIRDQVVFTKAKLDGAVYLISFTLDDGTQYAIELDAKTGMINTLDVHPVTGDISKAIGLLAAKDIALRQAGILDADVKQYTKARIDRSNAAYVYELEFETEAYEYAVTLDMQTGEILKYKAWYK